MFQNKAKKLQKLFSHRFSQNIWRIIPDSEPGSDQWIVELRDAAEKKASFALIDLGKNEVIWQKIPEATDWWTSLTAFSFGHIFLHNYRFQEIPEPTDLLMISAETGDLQWVLPNHVLVKTRNEYRIEVAQKTGEGFKYSLRNVETGVQVSEDSGYVSEVEPIILQEPVRYLEGNVYFERLASFIKEMTDGHEPICIDYLDKRPVMMFSYYIYEREKVSEYLLVVSDKMERIHYEQLTLERDGIGRSTMFLKGSKLVFLKNNNEFSSLTLS